MSYEDIIDSRDLIEELNTLEALEPEALDEEQRARLAALKAICEEGERYFDDWTYGVPLVADYYFTDYARVLLEDCGDLPKNVPWYIAIDWEQTARNIRLDYTSIEIDGRTYWGR